MYIKRHIPLALAMGILLAAPSYADDDTMVVLEDDDTPEDVVYEIPLPDDAADTARDASRFGRETAYKAQELGVDFGQEVSGDARLGTQGEDIRADVRDNARRDAQEANAPVDVPGGGPE